MDKEELLEWIKKEKDLKHNLMGEWEKGFSAGRISELEKMAEYIATKPS